MRKGIEMKPFNLEAALAGAKVINGNGNPATNLAYFSSDRGVYRVSAIIKGDTCYFTETGRISKESPNAFLDLFMAPDISEGWVNIYKKRKLGYRVHKTEEEARANASRNLIACVRIEWEDQGD
jgi:hypothetical protein